MPVLYVGLLVQVTRPLSRTRHSSTKPVKVFARFELTEVSS